MKKRRRRRLPKVDPDKVIKTEPRMVSEGGSINSVEAVLLAGIIILAIVGMTLAAIYI